MRIRESSAKRRCETDGAFLHTLTPSMPPTSSSYSKRLDNPSAHRRNKIRGEGIPLMKTSCWNKHVSLFRIEPYLISY
jgi:hypothetical protein